MVLTSHLSLERMVFDRVVRTISSMMTGPSKSTSTYAPLTKGKILEMYSESVLPSNRFESGYPL